MSLTVEQIRDILLHSLPTGLAWPRSEDSEWALLFEALASEFADIDALSELLIFELSPATATALFDEWERELGLPDACVTAVQTVEERRAAMIERFVFIGRQDAQLFIDVAARLGFTITITEFTPTSPGPAGNLAVVKPTGETFHVSPDGDEWNYVWRVNAPPTTISPRTYISSYGGDYTAYGNAELECALRHYAHDHRVLVFSYA